MKVRYKNPNNFEIDLTQGKIYEVLNKHFFTPNRFWYRLVDDSGEDYLYPPEMFEIIENSKVPKTYHKNYQDNH